MSECVEFIVVGAGMAGASAAFELSKHGTVVLLERESQPGYHTTGRSAAVFTEIYGNATIRALTVASGPFFGAPPRGFSDVPLWSPRPLIMLAREDQMGKLRQLHDAAVALVPTIRMIDAAQVLERIPVLRSDYVAGGLLEDSSRDLDVNAIHMGFLRDARTRGVKAINKAEVLSLTRSGGQWRVATSAGEFIGKTIINAAGAWADELAAIAGAQPVGLEPMRRTAFTFSFDPPQQGEHWPTIIDISEEFYFKPESGKFLGSPADETSSPPCDAQPEELDIAIAIDRIGNACNASIRSLHSKWAGLRSFVPDRTPVVGFDEAVPGFFWLAGQGGYGIQTAPAMARVAAALARHEPIPADIAALGVTRAALSPRRLREGKSPARQSMRAPA